MMLVVLAASFTSCEEYAEPVDLTPTLTTSTVSNITRSEALLSGKITAPNPKIIKKFGFRYSTIASLAESTEVTVSTSASAGIFTADIRNLQPNTTYYVQTFATGGFNEVLGNILSFSTSQYEAPVVDVTTASDVTESSVKLTSTLQSDGGAGLTALGFLYRESYGTGEIPTPDINDTKNWKTSHISNLSTVKVGSAFTQTLTGLADDREYDICAFATSMGANSSAQTGYGPIMQVRTERIKLKPDPNLPEIKEITTTTANAYITLYNEGTADVTRMGLFYTTHAFSQYVESLEAEGVTVYAPDPKNAICMLTGLTPGTTYYACSVAENENGVGRSTAVQFTTLTVTYAPTLGTTSVTDITETSAHFSSAISSDGGATITAKGFCYSTKEAEPTLENSEMLRSTSAGNVIEADLTGLKRGLLYYVRSYAENENGISYGKVTNFITSTTIVPPIVSNVTLLSEEASVLELSAQILNDGNGSVSMKGFAYKIANTDQNENIVFDPNFDSPETIHIFLSDLKPDTSYTIRAFASNEAGTGYSEEYFSIHTKLGAPGEGDAIFPNM